jgi:cell pole-organizing protein PopZ
MEEILASIRRIIADDETKPQPTVTPPQPAALRPTIVPPPQSVQPPLSAMNQHDIDAMPSGLDAAPAETDDDRMEDDSAAVLELTESMAAPAALSEPPVFRTIEGNSDVFFAEEDTAVPPDEPPAPSPATPAPTAAPPPVFASNPDGPLISSATSAAVDSAFNALANTVLLQNARTLEDLVQEMMRPMLKSWLDDNLPGLVERVVRAEIERVSRGRSG